MQKTITVTICDICEKDTQGDYHIETVKTSRTTRKDFHYCSECFRRHAHECDVCNDYYVHLREHKYDLYIPE